MKNVLFYSRVGFDFFPRLSDSSFAAYHAVHNKKEKQKVKSLGGNVVGCFEEEFDSLTIADFPPDYLRTGFYSDRFLGRLTIGERRMILGKLISFWERIFEDRKYDACIHETISFEPEEVLSLVAAKHKCKDMTYLPSIIDNYFYWKESPYSSAFSEDFLNSIIPAEHHVLMAQRYIKGVIAKGHNPFYVRNIDSKLKKTIKQIKILKKSFLKPFRSEAYVKRESLFYYDVNIDFYEYYRNTRPCIRNSYDRIEDYSGFKKVFFPLHYEPEAVLLYFCSKYSEQHSFIQEIAKILPLDTVLIVKEHPQQKGMLMTKKYFDLKKRNSNILYIPGRIPSIDLFSKVDMVATLASSVGFEAIIHNKPTAVFGNVFYDKHPEIYKLNNLDDFKKLVCYSKIKEPTYAKNIDYVSKIIALSNEGTISNSKYFHDPRNQELIAKSIRRELCDLI